MQIQELFERDIHRSINGVVKADEVDANSVWQELDEFVVTRELTTHLSDLVSVMLSVLEREENATGKNGIWISGFFGSGKSHFLKVMSYLLENAEHEHDGSRRRAVDFFDDKIEDAMLQGDLRRVTGASTDTILFNVDTKADHRKGRDALLQVFLKVLNEKQGYSGDHPHIAHMERHLDEKGKLDVFRSAFERGAGESWVELRDAWDFHRDEVVSALKEALGQSEESVERWVDGGEDNFSLTVENFAHWVKRFLDKQGDGHRVVFLVDEVGQFIAGDTHLMLNLQTITEQLGKVCDGQAWVVVTSQEDLDSVLGDMARAKQNDFSKIQGRFITRLSLSSANVDEVIKERLLRKNEGALNELVSVYDGKHDILKNQLSFVNAGSSFKTYSGDEDFSACYPFAAYQFNLVQKVFESIRKAGATGLHLAQGERSILYAFQSAALALAGEEVGALVPFHQFYPSVEGFLDTAVKRTIDQAGDNPGLEPFDSTILQVLFLIRYIEEVPGSVDNLVTLCVDEIDADRLSLRTRIEESLSRLESETLIARNGDLYFFLTNEETAIGREIKSVSIPSGAEERELGKLVFEDILGDMRKHPYSVTERDFDFNRLCDDHVVGSKFEGSLEVAFVSPLGDRHVEFLDDSRCILHTSSEVGCVLVRLPDDPSLGTELRTYLQTESYVRTKNTGTLPDTTKRILRDRSEDNRARRQRIVANVREMIGQATYFASGQKLEITRTDPKASLGDALEYLIKNAYPKMSFIKHLHPTVKQEIQSILRSNDLDQVTMSLSGSESNADAIDDVREYLRLCEVQNRQVVLRELIEKRYGSRPYGWPELEVVLLVARLAVLKEINLLVNAAPLELDQAYEHLTAANKQRKVVITRRATADGSLLRKARELGRDLFARQGDDAEDALFAFLQGELSSWDTEIKSYEPLARTGNYPGISEIDECLALFRKFVDERDSLQFLKRFVANKNELLDLAEDVQELQDFYKNQRHSWEQLSKAVEELAQNRLQLEGHAEAGPALSRMEEILKTQRPYKFLHEIAGLSETAQGANAVLVSEAREPAVAAIQALIGNVEAELSKVSATDELRVKALGELQKRLETASSATSIAHISQAKETADEMFNRALTIIEESQVPPPTPPTTTGEPGPVAPPPPVVKKRRLLSAREVWGGAFIETEAEMEEFLAKLRSELEDALKSDERIQIK